MLQACIMAGANVKNAAGIARSAPKIGSPAAVIAACMRLATGSGFGRGFGSASISAPHQDSALGCGRGIIGENQCGTGHCGMPKVIGDSVAGIAQPKQFRIIRSKAKYWPSLEKKSCACDEVFVSDVVKDSRALRVTSTT